MRDVAGLPLAVRAVNLARQATSAAGIIADVYVITDSAEIGWAVEQAGAVPVAHPPYDATTRTGDAVAYAASRVGWTGATLILQPTCATLSVPTLAQALGEWQDRLHATEPWECVVGVTDDTHIRWNAEGVMNPRSNDLPKNWKETGWFLTSSWPARGSTPDAPHIGYPLHLWETQTEEAVDINNQADLALARVINYSRSILVTCSGKTGSGSGHVRRQLALADLLDHRIVFDGRQLEDWAKDLISAAGYPIGNPNTDFDLQIVDSAEPDLEDLIDAPYGHVSFEDFGPVSAKARLVINALYSDPRPHALSGARWEVLPAYWRAQPMGVNDRKWITITFGGIDPEGATPEIAMTAYAVGGQDVRIVAPPNGLDVSVPYGFKGEILKNPFMPKVLAESKLVISSAGRTTIECAALGTPVLAFPVNEREERHVLPPNVIKPFPMWAADPRVVERSIRWVIERPELLQRLSYAGLAEVDGGGARRVAHHIDGLFL